MEDFSKKLRAWYRKNGRELPWRTTSDPYKIWLSEIILQQTRVDQGLPYYLKFIDNFPVIKDLANAKEDKVLRLWQGLGYYSRARNLHEAAKQIILMYDGKFPQDYASIRSLKGVGDYTAAAIASFSFNLPYPVVDGNVYRFLSRYAGIKTAIDTTKGKKEFLQLATDLLDKKNAATHNQAIMELGALICKPANPLCTECPFNTTCEAFLKGLIQDLPVKEKKTKVRARHFNFLILYNKDSVLLHQREEKDIWKGLFQFPLIEMSATATLLMLRKEQVWKKLLNKSDKPEVVSHEIKHLLSHQTIYARFWWIKTDKFSPAKELLPYRKIKISDLDHFGMPQLIVRYLKKEGSNIFNG